MTSNAEKIRASRDEILDAVEKAVVGLKNIHMGGSIEITAASLLFAGLGCQAKAQFEIAIQLAELNEKLGRRPDEAASLDRVPIDLVKQLATLNQKLGALASPEMPTWTVTTRWISSANPRLHLIKAPSARDAIAIVNLKIARDKPTRVIYECRLATDDEVAHG